MYNVRIDLSVYLTIYLSIQSNPYHVHKHRNLWSDLHEQHECLGFQENPPLLMAIAPKSGQLFPGWWSQPLWKIWKSNAIIVPNIWKVIKAMFQSPPTSWSLLTDTRSLSFPRHVLRLGFASWSPAPAAPKKTPISWRFHETTASGGAPVC